MQCAKCGYELDPFETACPKCARAAEKPAVAPMPAQPAKPAPDLAVTAAVARVKQHVDDRPPIRDAPDRGWPLTIVLWLSVLLNLALLVLTAINGFYKPHDVMGTGYMVSLGTAGLFFTFIPVMTLVALLVLLNSQRWGLGLYTICALFFVYTIAVHPDKATPFDWGNLVLGVLMVILIFSRWDQFE